MESRPSRHCGRSHDGGGFPVRLEAWPGCARPRCEAQATGRDGTVTLLDPQQPVARLLDLLCVDDMISIRARVTRDIQPGTSADGG
jgi:hypothetical protein